MRRESGRDYALNLPAVSLAWPPSKTDNKEIETCAHLYF